MKNQFNEVELKYELQKYLELNLENFQSQLEREQKSYEHSQSWLPENWERTEKLIQLLQMKVKFYQTQLNNLQNTK